MFENSANIEGHSQKTLAVTGTGAATTDPLRPGLYALWSDVDIYIAVNETKATAAAVTTSTGFPIFATSPVMPIRISRPCFLGGVAGSSGTLYYHKVGN